MVHLVELTNLTTQFLAESSSDDDGSGLIFLILLAGPAFFSYVYMRYRNADKRHHHESETMAEVLNMEAGDNRVRKLKGVSNSKMEGANHRLVKGKWGSA